MDLRLLRPGDSREQNQSGQVPATPVSFVWTPLRWVRDTVGLLSGAALLAWLVVYFSR